MKSYSPLRYPGGKSKLAPFIKLLYRQNGFCDGTYIEPYAGGAGVALSLLLEELAWNIVVNDIDKRVYAFWWAVLYETDALCRKIMRTPVSMEEWYRQKDIHEDIDSFSLFDVGFATFFLNRTNRSGILQGGVIGGKQQTGPYKIDARYNKKDLCDRIELIGKYRTRIHIHNEDAFDFVTRISDSIEKRSFFYFDPPYYCKGNLLYRNSYCHDDHKKIATLIKTLKHPWIVTYDNTTEIKKLYSTEKQVPFEIAYSANRLRTRGKEILFHSETIQLPMCPFTRAQDRDRAL